MPEKGGLVNSINHLVLEGASATACVMMVRLSDQSRSSCVAQGVVHQPYNPELIVF
jgi:hypothetical protein